MQQRTGNLGVKDLAAQRVVFDRTFHQRCEIHQLQQFRERAADLKTGEGLTVALAGVNPFPMMALGGQERLRRAGFDA